MGSDLNIRQERFIAEYLKTLATAPSRNGNASRAYMLAGYQPKTRNSLDVSACKLLKHPKIKAAIRQKRRAMLKRSDITLEKLLSDADDARQLAMRIDQPAAATSAVQLQAKLVGLLVDRKESGAPGDFAAGMTADDAISIARERHGEAAALALQALLAPPAAPPPASTDDETPPTPTIAGSNAIN